MFGVHKVWTLEKWIQNLQIGIVLINPNFPKTGTLKSGLILDSEEKSYVYFYALNVWVQLYLYALHIWGVSMVTLTR